MPQPAPVAAPAPAPASRAKLTAIAPAGNRTAVYGIGVLVLAAALWFLLR